MADTTVAASNVVKQWDSNFFAEYVRDNRFSRYMGTDENSVIQVREDLIKKRGDQVTIPIVGRLTGPGALGNQVLEGVEEELDNYGWPIPVDVNRNAVAITEWEEQKTAIELRDAARMMLKLYFMEVLRGGAGVHSTKRKFGIIDNLQAIYDGTDYVLYGSASEAQKDAWLTNNADRVLFGAAKVNGVSNDQSVALATIDNTADKLTAASLSLAKRMAKTADPHIRPIRTMEDEEWYVQFSGSQAFRDLKADMAATNRDGWERYGGQARTGGSGTNPLFRDSDIVYDGVIVREVPEIEIIASTIDVSANFLCGAQAVGCVYAQRSTSRLLNGGQGTDYGFRHGVGMQEMRGCRKVFRGETGEQHGVLTHFTAAVADA